MSRGAGEPRTPARDPCAHRRRRLGWACRKLLCTRARHGHDEIEAVEEGQRELGPKGREPLRRALALGRRVAAARTGAQVHRRHELEPSREERLALHPRDRDDAVLERLPERLEGRSLELRQLVEQQDAVVREARLARPRSGAAADDRRGRGAVMRRPEGAVRDQWALRRKHAGDRVDPHHLERLPRLERGQDRRQAPAEHRLPGSGWPGKQQVVAAGRRELERAPRPLLPADVGQVWMVGLGRLVGRLCRRRPQLAAEVRDCLGEMAHGDRLDAAELRLAGRLGRAENPLEAGAARTFGDGERAAHRPDAAVESELADGRMLGEPLDRNLPRRSQHRQRDREVEAGAFLAQPGRREVDRDPLQRPLELRRPDAAANAVLRLRAGAVGETDDREAGEATVDVRLDLDTPRLEADESVGDGAREHTTHGTAAGVTSV